MGERGMGKGHDFTRCCAAALISHYVADGRRGRVGVLDTWGGGEPKGQELGGGTGQGRGEGGGDIKGVHDLHLLLCWCIDWQLLQMRGKEGQEDGVA